MAYSALTTRLPLDECAEIIGANPAMFNQAFANDLVGPCGTECSGLWTEWTWQTSTGLSRSDLARTVALAEAEIANYLGRPLAPTARTLSVSVPPNPDANTLFMGMHVALPRYLDGYVPFTAQYVGSVDLVVGGEEGDPVTISYVDEEGDGYAEMAYIVIEATTAIDENNLIIYAGGGFGLPASQIRPFTSVTYVDVGEVRTMTVRIPRWQIIKPELLFTRSAAPNVAIDLLTPGIEIESIDFGYMAEDNTAPRVRFAYTAPTYSCGQLDCHACAQSYQYGDWRADGEGRIWIYPAEYNEETGLWEEVNLLDCICGRRPSSATITYYDSLSAPTPRSELDLTLKQAVAVLAGARFTRVRCDCDCGNAMQFRLLQVDMGVVAGAGRYTSAACLNSPFGTRVGEQDCWNALQNYVGASGLVVRHGSR